MDYLKQYYNAGDICLDIGCGSCRKIISVLDVVKLYYAIDHNPSRIKDAQKLCSKYNNIILGVCDNYFLPFDSGSFDLVSSFMTKYSVPEIWRVLKPNGFFIIEIPGANNRRSLNKKFGKDKLGWRGRMVCDTYSEHLWRIETELSPFFSIRQIEHICFETSLKTVKLIELLHMTDEIRNFGSHQDISMLKSIQSTEGMIAFEEERILLVTQKTDAGKCAK